MAMTEVETLHRDAHAPSLPSPDYRRVRLASALRDAAAAEPSGLQLIADWLTGGACLRGVRAGLVVMAACAVLVAVRAATERNTGTPSWGALPEASLTPGAVSTLTATELCNGVRPSRFVTEAVRRQVVRAYRIEQVSSASYELDALITPELGGSTDPANLWPQPYRSPVWNAHVKDALEQLLPELVCSQQITLAEAQRALASNWVTAYKHYFKTDAPIRSHLGSAPREDAELLVVPDEPTMQAVTRFASRWAAHPSYIVHAGAPQRSRALR